MRNGFELASKAFSIVLVVSQMKKQDFNIEKKFSINDNLLSFKFNDVDFQSFLDEEANKSVIYRNRWQRILEFIRRIWAKPETKVILFLLLTRIFFVVFTHWGMDFDFYIRISQLMLNGEELYVDIESTHMPLVDLIYVLMFAICPWKTNIYAIRIFMKFPFVLSDIAIALAVMRIVEKELMKQEKNHLYITNRPNKKVEKSKLMSGYFIAFCLPLILQSGCGRYDSLMILCFTMVLFCLQKKDWFGVAFFAALGTSTKYIGIIFLPFVVFWMKKDDIIPFAFGFILGLLPVLSFLLTNPQEFISAIFLRGSHIAYGFSIWHAVFIIWNKFDMKYVDGIESTYDSSGEPWFVRNLYLPMFILVYSIVFILYIRKYWGMMKTDTIDSLPISKLALLVFIPLFVFSLSFKAINIQVLAWFAPYFAINKKKGMLIEYTILTVVHGLALVIFEAYDLATFLKLSQLATSENSDFWILIANSVSWVTNFVNQKVWVGIIFSTILWFNIRTSIELVNCTKELQNYGIVSHPSTSLKYFAHN